MPAFEITSAADLEQFRPVARSHSSTSQDSEGINPWPLLISFGACPVDRMREDLLPGPVGDMARAIAAATETPIEMAVMTGLGIIAASIATKVRICPSQDYSEPPQLYVATALPSGNRKTAVINEMAAPLREAEARLIAELTPTRKRLQSERKTLEARIDKLRRKAAAAADPTPLAREIAQLEVELPVVPPAPRLWTQDITPERLGAIMAENGERMSVVSDEGGIFDILAGRYSKNGAPNLDLFLQAHSGSPVRVDRGSREPVILNAPALTLILTPQPHVLRSLSEQKAFRGRGLLARFLFMMPRSTVGRRTHNNVAVPRYIREAYGRCAESLLNLPCCPETGPVLLHFSTTAGAAWRQFRSEVECQMAEDGPLHDLQDWGSKLPGAVARIAGVVHCSLYAGGAVSTEIEIASMKVAIELGAILISHALAAFRTIQKPEKVENAEKLLAWILRNGKMEFSLREMFRAHQSRFGEVAAMMPAVVLVQEHGYILPASKERKPGRPSDLYWVNPEAFESPVPRPTDDSSNSENQ